MDHDAVVEDWQRNAESHDRENYEFLRSLKFRRYGFKPDQLAARLHEQAFQIVQCTRCANCCKTLDIKFSDEDVSRIAKHLGMTVEQFIAAYLEPDEEDKEDGPYNARGKPCPFLGKDDHCTIYEVRPKISREYPHTDKKGFATRTMLHANNALTCPAVYWIIEQMKRRALG
jgi:Fe-S-cluster containining protein